MTDWVNWAVLLECAATYTWGVACVWNLWRVTTGRAHKMTWNWRAIVPIIGFSLYYRWVKRQEAEVPQVSLPPGATVTLYFTAGGGAGGGGGASAFTISTAPPFKPALALPVRQQEDTIRAWRRARLYLGAQGRGELGSVFQPVRFGIDAVAECRLYPVDMFDVMGHGPVPEPGCKCGFYAVTKERYRDELREQYGAAVATLDVELFGRVVRHENGYRAERQRVLGVTVDRQCGSRISVDGVTTRCTAEVDGVAVGNDGLMVLVCDRCRSYRSGLSVLTLDEVARSLGTEVRWAS